MPGSRIALGFTRDFHRFLVKPPYKGRQGTENFEGNGRIWEDSLPKMFGAQDQQYALLHRHDVSRARAVLKDGQVTEELPGVLGIEGLCCRAKVFHDIHLARNDQVQFLAVIPVVNNSLTT